VLEGYV
jgi:hypothetical protein